ncbi:MAG TPA: type IV toxin-antitoxin system AbiEi family antitoxin domain-containing protein [Frankiaceae bacterium]|nr:type IV toxin-antitoxin system AbiEi family antitoxin domain-containing protein [Frankiaceae bacterium]
MLEPDPEHAVAYGIFSVRQARSAGYSDARIRRNVERGRWQRSRRGVLEVVGREPQAGDPIVRELLTAGPRAVVAFAPAAEVHGWDLGRLPDTPRVILPPGVHGRCANVRHAPLGPDEVESRGVIVVTTPLRTALDLASVLARNLGVVALDTALRLGVPWDELARCSGARRSGVRRAREALELADPRSGSVPETQARLLFHDAGLPPPVSQQRLHIGGMDMRVDFAWAAAKVVVEIDGRRWHIDGAAFQLDRTRQNALVQAGWLVLRFTVEDIRLRPEYVVAEVRRALDR